MVSEFLYRVQFQLNLSNSIPFIPTVSNVVDQSSSFGKGYKRTDWQNGLLLRVNV
jgi:hypothetical protein